MASSSVEQNRNATPSWSGYIHQGKVGFLVALRQLKKCIDDKVPNYENYVIRYENAEDFDIVDDQSNVVSRHQVKAYTNGNERESYSDLFQAQTRKFKKGKEVIDIKGYQIHEFDGMGKIVYEVVPSDSRYLHVIVDVPDFRLLRHDYLKKYGHRKNYTDNSSCVRLYPYDEINNIYYCPLSQDDNNDTIRDYCIAEIKEILKLKNNPLKENDSHFSQVYLKYVGSLLDHSIGKSHNNSAYPEISFGEIIAILEEKTPKDEVFEIKNKMIYSWEKYRRDYAEDIDSGDLEQMDEIINSLLSMSKEKFCEFVRLILPHEKSDENILELFAITSLENIFYLLLEKTKSFSFKGYNYLDNDGKSYRVSLIDIQNRPGRIAKIVKEIINNSEFLKATFNHDFLINRSINDISIDSRIDELTDIPDNIRYKDEWDTGIKNSIFNANMEFIKIDTALEKELRTIEE
ncbi:ABC-three component system protein [Streptococcus sanguinis]|uniref:ABC-three component systems C-terminal domain-containing protein n=1 Tax=Streptococcus sanguinis SK353 TaxID=888815 RepID=F0FCQ5_STRSA|nr:ABC-three component system protein [Streptococcus sanguinis]EGC23529.1 hypothetical protein HMPREF9388_0438 [Streptococcus sanguinis SK353]